MKTVLFCNLVPGKAGAFERLLGDIGRASAAAGDTFMPVLAGEPIPVVAAAWRQTGMRWRLIPGWDDASGVHPWRFWGLALRILAEERPDVAAVSFGNELPTLAAALASRRPGARAPRWVWQQDQQIRDPGPLSARISKIRALSWGIDHFIVVYEGGRQSLVRRGIAAERVDVIYNRIADHVPVRPAGWLRKEVGLPPDAVVAVCAGSLIARKRPDFVLAAIESVRARHPGMSLLFIGEGPLRTVLEPRAGGAVRLLGLRNDVRDVLAEADLLVHAALAETCTYAITESMAAGIPAVVTDAGAAREQVADGESGYVLAPGDAAGFAERVGRLAGDSALRAAFGRAARARWAARFHSESPGDAYHAVYRQVLGA